jgi:hypothetical protein
MTKQIACKLCGKTFVCNNGMWFTTCDCARLRPEELKAAQAKYDSECQSKPAAARPAGPTRGEE